MIHRISAAASDGRVCFHSPSPIKARKTLFSIPARMKPPRTTRRNPRSIKVKTPPNHPLQKVNQKLNFFKKHANKQRVMNLISFSISPFPKDTGGVERGSGDASECTRKTRWEVRISTDLYGCLRSRLPQYPLRALARLQTPPCHFVPIRIARVRTPARYRRMYA